MGGAQTKAILSHILRWLEMRTFKINGSRLIRVSNGPRGMLETPSEQTETISVSKRTIISVN